MQADDVVDAVVRVVDADDLRRARIRVLRSGFIGADDHQVRSRALWLHVSFVHLPHIGEELRHHRTRRATARFHIGDQSILCIDSPVTHTFSFTPAFSLFVECESEAQIRAIYAALSDGGEELMPLANYGFSREFAWVNDRFGVSWQLNLK